MIIIIRGFFFFFMVERYKCFFFEIEVREGMMGVLVYKFKEVVK